MSTVIVELTMPSGQKIQVRQGDLTAEATDAIVNAANGHLAHGGGVAGAIVRRGGAVIQEESAAWVATHGPVPTGQVAVTGAGALPCRQVIHAVGPVWQGGDAGEEEALRAAATNSLRQAHQLKLGSLAMPAISSGIFGFPKDRCAEILVDAAIAFCRAHGDSPLREIRFTNIDAPTVEVFRAELERRRTGEGGAA